VSEDGIPTERPRPQRTPHSLARRVLAVSVLLAAILASVSGAIGADEQTGVLG